MRLRIGLLLATCLLLAAGLLTIAGHDPGSPETAASAASAAAPHARPTAREPGRSGGLPPAASKPVAGAGADVPLPERLAALVGDADLAGRTVGVSVTAADGRPVFEHRADAQLVPASTQKLLVAAAAIPTLGPGFRYETTLHATVAPDPDGVVHGDLVLVGSGDPALGTPLYGQLRPDRPRTPLEALADQAVAGGITRITGGVLGDPRVFPHEPQAPGWLPRYLEDGDTTRSSGLTAEGGRSLFPEGGRVRSEPAADPAATAAASLHGLLTARGVHIDGSAASTTTPPPAAVRVGSVTSPPMLDLLRYAVQRSDNHLADAIFRTIGAAAGDPSWAGSAAATQRALSALGLDFSDVAVADGSGLSRGDRLSAAFLTALDARMTASPHGGQWQSLMSVAGESGTLRRRLLDSVAQGRMRGKTGSLEDVVSLSGVVVGPAVPRYHFAVVGNDLDTAGKDAVRKLQDLLVLTLAEELYGCRQVPAQPLPVDAVTPPGGEWRLECAAETSRVSRTPTSGPAP